jgi:membrane-bound lytic murein transglycosylase
MGASRQPITTHLDKQNPTYEAFIEYMEERKINKSTAMRNILREWASDDSPENLAEMLERNRSIISSLVFLLASNSYMQAMSAAVSPVFAGITYLMIATFLLMWLISDFARQMGWI